MKYLIAFLLATSFAHAASVPQPSKYDTRITLVEYVSEDVVEVSASVGIVTSIIFDEGEIILNPERDVQAGFADGWSFFANGNILHIKPVQFGETPPTVGQWSTNVFVVTSVGRVYEFFVTLSDGSELSRPAFRVQFKYSDAIQVQAKAEHAVEVEQAKAQAVKDEPLIPDGIYYDVIPSEGASDIRPDVVFDNGNEIFMRFPVGKKIPAVFYLSTKGADDKQKETIANPRSELRKIRGDTTDQSRSIMLAVDKNRGSGEIMLRLDELAIHISPKE